MVVLMADTVKLEPRSAKVRRPVECHEIKGVYRYVGCVG